MVNWVGGSQITREGRPARLRIPLRLAALARAALMAHPQVEDRGGPIVRWRTRALCPTVATNNGARALDRGARRRRRTVNERSRRPGFEWRLAVLVTRTV